MLSSNKYKTTLIFQVQSVICVCVYLKNTLSTPGYSTGRKVNRQQAAERTKEGQEGSGARAKIVTTDPKTTTIAQLVRGNCNLFLKGSWLLCSSVNLELGISAQEQPTCQEPGLCS